MKKKKTILDAGAKEFNGKRVLVRVDFNVPIGKDGQVENDLRIKAACPTIEFLQKAGAKIVLVSHLGRPKGVTPELSLKPVAKRLSELLKKEVSFLDDCVGEKVEQFVEGMKEGEICLLENVRFYPEEEQNDAEFAAKLARLADIYVNDAFGSAHRAHASTEGITKLVKPSLAGILMDKELDALNEVLGNPQRPFATIIGGAKVSSKIGVLESLIQIVDVLVVGGAMAFTFLKAMGKEVGTSLVEPDKVAFCRELMEEAEALGVKIVLPSDVVCAKEMNAESKRTTVSVNAIAQDQMGLDVGPQTMKDIAVELRDAKTIFWNGPIGVFEIKGFDAGTNELIDFLVAKTKAGVKTIVGGGDSLSALEHKGVALEKFSHVSTGGGAALEFIEGFELPGVHALDNALVASS